MMEKSTFDKNGIKRHEFLDPNFVSVSVIYRQAYTGINEAGVNSLPMTSTFSQQRGNKANTLSVAVLNNVNGFLVFSHFKKQNSTCLQQDQKSTRDLIIFVIHL